MVSQGVKAGDTFEIDASHLPPLPSLPSSFESAPFTHKSFIIHTQGSHPNAEEAERRSYKRSETVGDSVLNCWVIDWIVEQHPFIDSGTATRVKKGIVNNDTLARLAVHYGLDKQIIAYPPIQQWEHDTQRKMYADVYEAYLGVLWRAIRQRAMDYAVLDDYFNKLLGGGTFIALEDTMLTWQEAKKSKRQKDQARSSSKRQRTS